ncbi:MAG: hypothetical protein ACREQH_01430 [Candidatus Binatus sp.]
MRRPGIFMLAALAALILGFLARRIMISSAVHYIADRPPDRPQTAREANPRAAAEGKGAGDDSTSTSNVKSNADARAGSEQLTPSDRRELDTIIKRKGK